ncbi:MAG: hypothetical protein CL398_10050 [Acidiferrobacteraceae bacterium]|nr:hypothetical protein [Acidiferrobacteraceae bacterium]
MKKILNSPDTIVDDMLTGYVSAHSTTVKFGSHPRVIVRARSKNAGKVGLIIGNGSGHEPIAMGWVGEGLLDANAVGEIFAAPAPHIIVEGIKSADFGAGTILLVSSHSGDIINSEAAIEDAKELGIDVRSLLMYDDISSAPKGQEAERRGAPGTTFIYKILGAATEHGYDIDRSIALGAKVRDWTRTLGVAVAPGISPLTGKPMFSIPKNEIYIGIGVHGEPGIRQRAIGSASDVVVEVMENIFADFDYKTCEEVTVLVNGSGGTTLMELFIIYGEVAKFLKNHGIRIIMPMVGELVTTQETAGFSISLLRMDEEIKEMWSRPSYAPYFHL